MKSKIYIDMEKKLFNYVEGLSGDTITREGREFVITEVKSGSETIKSLEDQISKLKKIKGQKIEINGEILISKPRIAFNKWNSPNADVINKIKSEGIEVEFFDGLAVAIK